MPPMAGRRSRSRGNNRAVLRPLTSNEANKTNRKRKYGKSRNGTKTKAVTKTLKKVRNETQKKKKKNAVNDHEVYSDPFDSDTTTEPPTKKRRLSPRSTVSEVSELSAVPLAEDTPISARSNRNHTNSSPSNSKGSTPSKSLYPSGSIHKLHENPSTRHHLTESQQETLVQLKATNKELSKQNVAHRQKHKKWQKQYKKAMHERDSLRKLVQSLHQRDQKFKSERLKHMDRISELEVQNEKLTMELNRNLNRNMNHNSNADREQSVDIVMEDKSERLERDTMNQKMDVLKRQIKDIEYDASRWKLKYNKLLQKSNQVQSQCLRMKRIH